MSLCAFVLACRGVQMRSEAIANRKSAGRARALGAQNLSKKRTSKILLTIRRSYGYIVNKGEILANNRTSLLFSLM